MRSAAVNTRFAGQFYVLESNASTTKPDSSRSRPRLRLEAVALLLFCSVSASFSLAQAGSEEDREISRVESWFNGKSLDEINVALTRLRPSPVNPSDKALLLRDLPSLVVKNRVTDKRALRQLSARLSTLLKLYERVGIVELIIFRHSEPIVISKAGAVIALSTEILKIVGNDDGALIGIVAHELAHEYVALELLGAMRSKNLSRMRELELFCDAVAVIVLLDLGLDPVRYANALRRIATYSEAATELNNGQNSHPAVNARVRVISDIAALHMNRTARRKQ